MASRVVQWFGVCSHFIVKKTLHHSRHDGGCWADGGSAVIMTSEVEMCSSLTHFISHCLSPVNAVVGAHQA